MKELAFQLFRSGQFGLFLRTSIFVTKARDIIFLAGMHVQRETSIHLGVTGRKHLPYKRGNCMKKLAFQLNMIINELSLGKNDSVGC